MTEEPFTITQYCVFIDREDGPHVIAATYDADYALTKAALYYHDMNKHEHNDMDMSEPDRFYIRTRQVEFSDMNDERIDPRDVVREHNPWKELYWQ